MVNKVLTYVISFSIGLNIMLLITCYTLPDRLSESVKKAINTPSMQMKGDTIVKVVSESLTTKGDFVYFEGNVSENPFKFCDSYAYKADYPDEVFKGYFTVVKSVNGSKYYLWSRNKLKYSEIPVSGWFISVSDFNGFQYKDKQYLDVLFAVVRK